MKIYIIRHGETTGDLEDRYGGSYDDHLTEKGEEQLQETAHNLIGKGIELIFSSPLIRARQSAEIIGEEVQVPVEYVDGLRERHYGILTGLTKSEAREKYPKDVELYRDPKNTVTEGESYEDFNKRVIETFQSLITKDYEIIAIVSHGGPIKAIHRFLGKEIDRLLGDGEILELEIK